VGFRCFAVNKAWGHTLNAENEPVIMNCYPVNKHHPASMLQGPSCHRKQGTRACDWKPHHTAYMQAAGIDNKQAV